MNNSQEAQDTIDESPLDAATPEKYTQCRTYVAVNNHLRRYLVSHAMEEYVTVWRIGKNSQTTAATATIALTELKQETLSRNLLQGSGETGSCWEFNQVLR